LPNLGGTTRVIENIYSWECPICGSVGKKQVNRFKALRFGYRHLHKRHDDAPVKPILTILTERGMRPVEE